MGVLIFVWLIVELIQRKKPREQRIPSAAKWAFGISFVGFFGDDNIFPNGLEAATGSNWVAFGISFAILVLFTALLYGLRLLGAKAWDKFSKKPAKASTSD